MHGSELQINKITLTSDFRDVGLGVVKLTFLKKKNYLTTLV